MKKAKPSILIIGNSISAGFAAIKAVELGMNVRLLIEHPFARSHDVSISCGIDANTSSDDSSEAHLSDIISAGDGITSRKRTGAMCDLAPNICSFLDRIGVPFDRSNEGFIAPRRSSNSKYARTAYAGELTSLHIVAALERELRRIAYEDGLALGILEGMELASIIKDSNGRCIGATAINCLTLEVEPIAADAVIICSGGYEALYSNHIGSQKQDGASIAQCFIQGAKLSNLEFYSSINLAIKIGGSLSEICESILLDGAKIQIGSNMALDLSQANPLLIERRYPILMKRCAELLKLDPFKTPIPLKVAVRNSIGGISIDDGGKTSIDGLFAAGGSAVSPCGANASGPNMLLTSAASGIMTSKAIADLCLGSENPDPPASLLDDAKVRVEDEIEHIAAMSGKERPAQIDFDLKEIMFDAIKQPQAGNMIQSAINSVRAIKERIESIGIADTIRTANREISFTRRLVRKTELAEALLISKLAREESRGEHIRADFPKRDDAHFMRTSFIEYSKDGHKLL